MDLPLRPNYRGGQLVVEYATVCFRSQEDFGPTLGQRFGLQRNLGDTIRGSRKWLGWSWRHINLLGRCDFSDGFGPKQTPKWEALRRSDFGSSEKAYLVVYYPVCDRSCGILR